MKKLKNTVVMLAMIILPAVVFGMEPVEGVLEITGSIGTTSMMPYTPVIDLLTATVPAYADYYNSYGESRQASSIYSNSGLDAYLGLYITDIEAAYMIAPYFRFGAVFSGKETDELSYGYYSPVTLYQDRKDVFDMSYAGFGVRRYFTDIQGLPFNIYFGCDLGYFSTLFMNPHSQIINYTDPSDKEGSLTVKNRIDRYSGGFFGFNLEVGADCWINRNFGITFKGGLKNGSGNIRGTLNSTDKNGNPTAENGKTLDQELNMSGLYISAGIIFSLGQKTLSKPAFLSVKEPAFELLSAANTAVENGDTEYTQENYKAALIFYDKALFYIQNAKLYKKIANCLFNIGNKEESIKMYELALRMNPRDNALREWLKNNY